MRTAAPTPAVYGAIPLRILPSVFRHRNYPPMEAIGQEENRKNNRQFSLAAGLAVRTGENGWVNKGVTGSQGDVASTEVPGLPGARLRTAGPADAASAGLSMSFIWLPSFPLSIAPTRSDKAGPITMSPRVMLKRVYEVRTADLRAGRLVGVTTRAADSGMFGTFARVGHGKELAGLRRPQARRPGDKFRRAARAIGRTLTAVRGPRGGRYPRALALSGLVRRWPAR